MAAHENDGVMFNKLIQSQRKHPSQEVNMMVKAIQTICCQYRLNILVH